MFQGVAPGYDQTALTNIPHPVHIRPCASVCSKGQGRCVPSNFTLILKTQVDNSPTVSALRLKLIQGEDDGLISLSNDASGSVWAAELCIGSHISSAWRPARAVGGKRAPEKKFHALKKTATHGFTSSQEAQSDVALLLWYMRVATASPG